MPATDKELEALAANATPSGGDSTASPAQLLGYRPTDIQTAQGAAPAPAAPDPVGDAVLANQPLKTPDVAAGAPPVPGDAAAPAAPPLEYKGNMPAVAGVDPSPPPPSPFTAPPVPGGMAGASKAQDQAAQAGYDVAAAQAKVGEAKAKQTDADADQVDRLASDADRRANEIQQARDHRQQALDSADGVIKKELDEQANWKPTDYWANKSTWEHVKARIYLMLGGAQSGHMGTADTGPAYLQSLAQQDYQHQLDQLTNKERITKQRQEGRSQLASGLMQDIGLLQIQQGAKSDMIGNEIKAQLMRNGIPAEQAANDVTVKTFQEKALQQRAEGREKIAQAQAQISMAKASLGLRQQEIDAARQDRKDKAADAQDARTVQLDDGSDLRLPTARGVPQFTAGYNTRIQAVEKLKALRADLANNESVYGPDAVANRKRLIDNALSGVASITPMGQSDHSTHVELGTLGPGGVRTMPWDAGPEVAVKALDAKIAEVEEGTARTIRAMRKDGGTADSAPKSSAAPSSTPAPANDRLSLAKRAIQDPDASPAEKAQAKKILKAAAGQ